MSVMMFVSSVVGFAGRSAWCNIDERHRVLGFRGLGSLGFRKVSGFRV